MNFLACAIQTVPNLNKPMIDDVTLLVLIQYDQEYSFVTRLGMSQMSMGYISYTLTRTISKNVQFIMYKMLFAIHC